MGVTAVRLLGSLGLLVIIVQAQNCGKPVPGPNMDLKGNDILLTEFPDGTKVTFACNVGYTSAGGSPSITCTAGSWSTLRLNCAKKTCGAADEVEHGRIEYQPGNEFGDKAVVVCNIGYMPVGKGTLFCGDQGWEGRLPTCEVVTYESPPAIVDGSYSPNKDTYDYREFIRYTCTKGYTLNGANQLSCSDDGTFTPGLPKCIPQNCGKPVPGPNMDLKGNDILLTEFPDGTNVTFACNVGYTCAGGSPSITCTAGSWSTLSLNCEKKTCGAADEVEHGRIEYQPGNEFGDKAVVVCNIGYMPVGKGTLFCGDQGWEGRLPTCEVVTCESPPAIVDGSYSPNKDTYDYREVIRYTCTKGYTLNGANQLSCSDDGTFTPGPPKCIPQNCGKPVPGPNMDLKGNDILLTEFPDGTNVTFACSVGYTCAGGSPSITCTAGSWSTLSLNCEKKTCGAADEVEHGRIEYQPGNEFGDKAVVVCNVGYMPVGKGALFCGDQGWEGRLPICEVVTCESPPAIVDGSYSPNKDTYDYREVIQYTCTKGYTLNGANQLSCSDDGTFTPGLPKCIQ